jgi:hypothetical protein
MDKLKGEKISQNLTYDRVATMFESDLETNGKPHSKQIEDSMNPLLCSSKCATPQRLSKL